jgi:hypothetical protein
VATNLLLAHYRGKPTLKLDPTYSNIAAHDVESEPNSNVANRYQVSMRSPVASPVCSLYGLSRNLIRRVIIASIAPEIHLTEEMYLTTNMHPPCPKRKPVMKTKSLAFDIH